MVFSLTVAQYLGRAVRLQQDMCIDVEISAMVASYDPRKNLSHRPVQQNYQSRVIDSKNPIRTECLDATVRPPLCWHLCLSIYC